VRISLHRAENSNGFQSLNASLPAGVRSRNLPVAVFDQNAVEAAFHPQAGECSYVGGADREFGHPSPQVASSLLSERI
jgi:hypothetical protein